MARLVLEGEGSIKLIYTNGYVRRSQDAAGVIIRAKIFDCLIRKYLSFSEKEYITHNMVAAEPSKFIPAAAAYLATFNRMESECGDMLAYMVSKGGKVNIDERIGLLRYERVCEYFIFRHLFPEGNMGNIDKRLKFCFFATRFICCLEALGYENDALRMFSKEIEYFDENVDKILDIL